MAISVTEARLDEQGPGVPPGIATRLLLRLVLFGTMEAWAVGGVSVLARSRKPRALLAMLAMADGEPIPRATLAGALWSRRGEEQQRGSLRQALHELQETLVPLGKAILVSSRDSIALRAESVWADALEFERGRIEPSDLMAQNGAGFLRDLEGLDPAFDAWIAERRRLLHARGVALAARRLHEAPDDHGIAAAARALLTLEPGHRAGWHALIAAETARGERGAALAAYEACRTTLADRFATQPLPETEALALTLRGAPQTPAPATRPARAGLRGARLGVPPLRIRTPQIESYLASSLAEEITAALARFRWIFVADSASLAGAAERHGSEVEAARALGIDLLLSGTLGSDGTRLRISLRLTDLREPAAIVWAQHFDRDSSDMMTLQETIANEVVARLDPEILLIEANHASARGAATPSGYDLLLRAIAAIHRLDRNGFVAAGGWLRDALNLEPDCAAAHAWFAYWYLFLVGQGWAMDTPELIAEAEYHAGRAIALDPLDALALTVVGHVRAFLNHRVDEASALHERALALNPNLAMAWVFSGMAQSYIGNHHESLRRLDRYRQLAPFHPHAFFFDAARGIPLLCMRRHEESVEVGRNATALRTSFSYPYKTYLAALGHLGWAAETRDVRARLLAVEPDFNVEKGLRRTPLRREEDRAHYAEGLRLAGLE